LRARESSSQKVKSYFTIWVQMQPAPMVPQGAPVPGSVQSSPAQQALVAHDCPISEQMGALARSWPGVVPPSGGGTVTVEQTPASEPGGMMQVPPGQQSAVVVQVPPSATHMEPQTSWPIAFGTQGWLLQHSPLKLQAPPGATQVPPSLGLMALQRGIPSRSSWQHSLPAMQAQQSLRSLELEQA
jgi:hypothetical protein